LIPGFLHQAMPEEQPGRCELREFGLSGKIFYDSSWLQYKFSPLFCRFCAALPTSTSLFLGQTSPPGKKIPANMSNFICIAAILLRCKKI
jgi:hypothetical protein